MKQMSIMMSVPDMVRADVLLTEDRIYYRFATEETLEDGDLPGLKGRYLVVEARLKESLANHGDETPLDCGKLKLTVFVDNVKYDTASASERGLRRVITELIGINDVFQWLNGFLS